MKSQPYITFRGECQQALDFYRKCLGGEIKNRETYEGKKIDIPENYRKKLQHAELKGKGIHIMAYDASPDTPVHEGNQIAISLYTDSKEETEEIFNSLSAGGQKITPLEKTSWNAYYGRCKDKFGVHWMVNHQM